MHRRLFRVGSAAVVAAAAVTVLGSGVASASPLDDDGGNGDGGQPGSSADSSYTGASGNSPDSSYSGYQSQYPSDSGVPGGSTNRSNPTDGVLNGLSSPAAPANAGSGVTPNGFSPGQTLPGGSLGGL